MAVTKISGYITDLPLEKEEDGDEEEEGSHLKSHLLG